MAWYSSTISRGPKAITTATLRQDWCCLLRKCTEKTTDSLIGQHVAYVHCPGEESHGSLIPAATFNSPHDNHDCGACHLGRQYSGGRCTSSAAEFPVQMQESAQMVAWIMDDNSRPDMALRGPVRRSWRGTSADAAEIPRV